MNILNKFFKIKDLLYKIQTLELIYNELLDNDSETININNVYVVVIENNKYFARAVTDEKDTFLINFINIFNNEKICSYRALSNIDESNIHFYCKIIHMYKELTIYEKGNVPKTLLQCLYYKANGIKPKYIKKTIKLINDNKNQ